MPKSILLMGRIGLPDPSLKWNSENIPPAIEKEEAKFRDAGCEVEHHFIDTRESEADMVKNAREAVRSKKWDGISVGMAIRGTVEYTAIFEAVVNMCIEEISPPPKLMFATAPDTGFDAAVRVGLVKE